MAAPQLEPLTQTFPLGRGNIPLKHFTHIQLPAREGCFGVGYITSMTLLATIVESEGFRINLKKTYVMHESQRQEVCGVVVNEKPNVRRCEYDQLKAILYNCVKHGPASQNRQSYPCFKEHLLGRIAALSQLHASRGDKLRKVFEGVVW